jgi:hypothetical protein
MKAAVLGCVATLCGVAAAQAVAVSDVNQLRNPRLQPQSSAVIIAGPASAAHAASGNRGTAPTEAAADAEFDQAVTALSSAEIDAIVASVSSLTTTRPTGQQTSKTEPKGEPITPITRIADAGDAQKGLAYAQQICSACHNVLKTDAASPNRQAPPFKAIANTPGMTITALNVWSRTSHPTMPNLVIEPADMDHLIAYILSLQEH